MFFLKFVFLLVSSIGFSTLVSAQDVKVWIPGWQDASPLSVARAGSAVIEDDGVIYALGGIDGRNFLATTEYSRILDNGTLSPWQTTTVLTEPRGFFSAAVHNGYIYAVGGGNGPAGHNLLNTVERAKILPDGNLSLWQKEKYHLNMPRRCVKIVAINNRLYALGGFAGALLDSIESAPILPNGQIGKWRLEANTFTVPRYVHTVKKHGNTLFVLGGHDENQGIGLSDVGLAVVDKKGQLGPWRAVSALLTERYALSAAIHNNVIYAMGGLQGVNYLRRIEKATLGANDHDLNPWSETNPLTTPRANFGVITYKDWIYIIGGTNNQGYFDTVEYATFNDNGDIGFWGDRQQGRDYEERELNKKPISAVTALPLPNEGVVQESIDVGQYSYLRIATNSGEEWIAAARGTFANKERIRYSQGVMMENFYSKSLQRRFTLIRFVSGVERIESQ